MRDNAAELLARVTHASALLRTKPLTDFGGLSEFLDQVLPTEHAAQERIARALDLSPEFLRRFRRHEVDPYLAPSAAFAVLGHAFGLVKHEVAALLAQDHARFAGNFVAARGAADSSGDNTFEFAFDSAWEREELDDASRLGSASEL